MKKYIATIIILITILPASAYCNGIMGVNDENLKFVLNNFELVKELNGPPYFIRIIKVREFGECSNPPDICPKTALYISTSTYDEYPDQALYKIDNGYNWKFVRWEVIPDIDGPDNFVVFSAIKKEFDNQGNGEVWKNNNYLISVNPWNATMRYSP